MTNKPAMTDILQYAAELECRNHGIWFSKSGEAISYPEAGNADCFAIEENSFWFQHRNQCIVEVMHQFPPGGTVFDVGGGNGYVSLAMQTAGHEVALIEPGVQGAVNAKARGLDCVVCATLETVGFTRGSLPAVTLFDVLEHIEHDETFLQTLRQLLRPDGRLYLTVPAYRWLWSYEDDHAGHYRRYTLRQLRKKLNTCGFHVDYQTYIFGFLPLPIFLFRTLPSCLRLVKHYKLQRARKEHQERSGLFGHLLNRWLGYEAKALKTKRSILFGGSCLVVASVKGAGHAESVAS